MNLPIVWAPTAEEDYAAILDYIETAFGTDAALHFLDKTEEIVAHIGVFPEMYPTSMIRPGIRKAVISPQTALLYRILETQIQLLHFWDNRQDPERFESLP